MYNNADHIVVISDLRAKVGNQAIGNVTSVFGESFFNGCQARLREFANTKKFKVTNTFVIRKDINK